MKKIIFILFISVNISNAQIIHVGLKAFEPIINIGVENQTSNIYYFSNTKNESVKYSSIGNKANVVSDYYPRPGLFVRYDTRGNLFFQIDASYIWFKTKNHFDNTVDPSEFVNVSVSEIDFSSHDYKTIEAKWRFIKTSLSVGYKFFKSKAIRPIIYGGSSLWILNDFKASNFDTDNRYNRHMIIFRNLDTFKPITTCFNIGMGISYKALTLSTQYEFSFGSVDRNSDIETDNLSLSDIKNYKNMNAFSLTISYNFISANLTKTDKKVKKHLRTKK